MAIHPRPYFSIARQLVGYWCRRREYITARPEKALPIRTPVRYPGPDLFGMGGLSDRLSPKVDEALTREFPLHSVADCTGTILLGLPDWVAPRQAREKNSMTGPKASGSISVGAWPTPGTSTMRQSCISANMR